MKMMRIVTGALEENCYLVYEDTEAVAIDPGADEGKINGALKQQGLTLKMILLTHGHADHIGAVDVLRKQWNCPVAIHKEDADMLTDPSKNLSAFMGEQIVTMGAEILFGNGAQHVPEDLDGTPAASAEVVRVGDLSIQVIHTPGHTPGGVCYLVDDMLFSGDTLFAGSIGRTDFPGGSYEEIMHSINDVIANLSGVEGVYPGHMQETTLAQEKRTNPYMR